MFCTAGSASPTKSLSFSARILLRESSTLRPNGFFCAGSAHSTRKSWAFSCFASCTNNLSSLRSLTATKETKRSTSPRAFTMTVLFPDSTSFLNASSLSSWPGKFILKRPTPICTLILAIACKPTVTWISRSIFKTRLLNSACGTCRSSGYASGGRALTIAWWNSLQYSTVISCTCGFFTMAWLMPSPVTESTWEVSSASAVPACFHSAHRHASESHASGSTRVEPPGPLAIPTWSREYCSDPLIRW
mmetsp:Transcript_65569/g.186084  ORF Transcript_65569/g.186084 Transcript_65569/m.186084 type:complete len:247 (+) Transcript_65569:407-1147(+)